MLTLLDLAFRAKDRDCIACQCRPHVTFCGRYDPSDLVDVDIIRERCCPECYEIWQPNPPCPNCGCRWDDTCQLCEANG